MSISADDLSAAQIKAAKDELIAEESKSYYKKNGRFPAVSLQVQKLDASLRRSLGKNKIEVFNKPDSVSPKFEMTNFTSYQFASNILVPVDSFQFSFTASSDPNAVDRIHEGDIVTLKCSNKTLATGIVDEISVEVDGSDGEKISIAGRDLAGQLEDQSCISIDSKPIFYKIGSLRSILTALTDNTRIKSYSVQDAPTSNLHFATEPGETKMQALQRFAEFINCIFWMMPDGSLRFGKPNFTQFPVDRIVCNKANRQSNVLNIRATYGSARIPNIVVGVLTQQADTQFGIPANQILNNAANGPKRLLSNGHRLIKTVVTSYPDANQNSATTAASINTLNQSGSKYIHEFMKREMARQNINELIVQCTVAGHFNSHGAVYQPDTVYNIDYDRAGISKPMYLYSVEIALDPTRGQVTHLMFCNLGCIVADALAPGADSLPLVVPGG